jgi:raffinose/stachyose/melibiose transport system permease protein
MAVTEVSARPYGPGLPGKRGAPTLGGRRGDGVRRWSTRTVTKALIALILVVEIYPLLWLFTSSLKTQNDFFSKPLWSIPTHLDFSNYSAAWTTAHLATDTINSVTVTVSAVIMILVLGSAAAFALEVLIWRGRGTVLLVLVGGLMVPAQLILLPLFEIYYKVGVNNTLLPMIITYIGGGLPLTVFLMATYFRAVPRELFEACTLDGGGMFRCFFSVGLPAVRNGIFTVGMLMFFSVFNDLLIALTFNTSPSLSTIQVGLLNFDGQYGTVDYGPLLAAIAMVVGVLLVVYLLINKQIMKGLSSGAVKG